jgi:hypothetical protein
LIAVLGILLFGATVRPAAMAPATALAKAATMALDSGRCAEASTLFMAARSEGDLSPALLLGLSRSLECTGKMEEALGSTYMEAGPDSSGKVDLVLQRAHILRRLGLEDLAVQSEREVGVVPAEGSRLPVLVWDKMPALNVSLGWMDQFDNPHLALIPRKNASILSVTGVANPKDTVSHVLQSVPDSISLAGGSFQASSSLTWSVAGTRGGMWLGPSGSVALADDSVGWRSAGGGLDLDGYWLATQNLTVQVGISGSRTWFATESGPIPTQDETVGSIAAQWIRGAWSVSTPQTVRTLRTNAGAWNWSGVHALGAAREVVPLVKVSAGGSWAWNLDRAGSVDDEIYARVLEGEGLDTTKSLRQSNLYRSGRLVNGQFAISDLLSRFSVADLQIVTVPVSRNADWTQVGASIGATFGPWKSIALGLSGQWSETFYAHAQEGVQVDQSYAYHDTVVAQPDTIPMLLVLRDSTLKNEYLVRARLQDGPLVPWLWKIHRRDQCWTTQATATWRPRKWLSFRAAWTWSRNISNLGDYVDGASYFRNVVSCSGAVTW